MFQLKRSLAILIPFAIVILLVHRRSHDASPHDLASQPDAAPRTLIGSVVSSDPPDRPEIDPGAVFPLYSFSTLNVTDSAGCSLPPRASNIKTPIMKIDPVDDLIRLRPSTDCVVVSAIMRSSIAQLEKTAKEIKHPSTRCEYLLFSNDDGIIRSAAPSGWRVISFPYHFADDRIAAEQTKPLYSTSFRQAKWYKMNAYRLLPPSVRYFFWLDGDTLIENGTKFDDFIGQMVEQHASVGAMSSGRPSVVHEAMSDRRKYGKHRGGTNGIQTQGYIAAYYLQAVLQGFCEGYRGRDRYRLAGPLLALLIQTGWEETCNNTFYGYAGNIEDGMDFKQIRDAAVRAADKLSDELNDQPCLRHRSALLSAPPSNQMGMYMTKIVSVDLHNADAKVFLDYWYAITYEHLQDQVSIEIALWRFGVTPLLLPIEACCTLLGHGK